MIDKKMITHIGHVPLDVPMWWEDSTTSNMFDDEVVSTIDGGFIVYRAIKKNILITISSGRSQRQSRATVDALINLSHINAHTTITEYDGTTHNVDFVHERGGAVEFESIVDVRLSDMFLGKIKVVTI